MQDITPVPQAEETLFDLAQWCEREARRVIKVTLKYEV